MFRLTPGLILGLTLCWATCLPTDCFGQTEHKERLWIDNTGGFRIRATFLEVKDGNVILRRADNKQRITVPLRRLSDRDREHVRKIMEPEPKPETDTDAKKGQESESGENPPRDTEVKRPVEESESAEKEQPKPIVPDPPPGETTESDSEEKQATQTGEQSTDVGQSTDSGQSIETGQSTESDSVGTAEEMESQTPAGPESGEPPVDPANNVEDSGQSSSEQPNSGQSGSTEAMDNPVEGDQTSNDDSSETTEPNDGSVPSSVIPFKRSEDSEAKTEDGGEMESSDPDTSTATDPPPELDLPVMDDAGEERSDSEKVSQGAAELDSTDPATPDPATPDPTTPETAGNPEAEADLPSDNGMEAATEPGNSDNVEMESGDAEPPVVAETATQPVLDDRTSEEEELTPIDMALISVQDEDTSGSWANLSDEQLIGLIQLSGTLNWKGKVGVSHTLQPLPPNFEFVIGMRGAELQDAICNIGFVEINSLIDDQDNEYQPLPVPEGIQVATQNWMPPRRGTAGRLETSEIQPVYVNVEFPRPEVVPKSIKSVDGRFRVLLASQRRVVKIKDVSANQGLVEHPVLSDKGLDVVVSRPDDITMVVQITGDVTQVMDVKLEGVPEDDLGEIQMHVRGTNFYQFNFISTVPPDVDVDIRLVDETRTLSIPFHFERLQFSPDIR